jgi:hypothetical protein
VALVFQAIVRHLHRDEVCGSSDGFGLLALPHVLEKRVTNLLRLDIPNGNDKDDDTM